jgi:hypothetical protein
MTIFACMTICNEEGGPASRIERKGHQRAEENIRLLAGERGRSTDIDTTEMGYVYAQQFETGGHGNHDH